MNAGAVLFGFFLILAGLDGRHGGVAEGYRGEAIIIGVIISVVGLLLLAGRRSDEKLSRLGCLHCRDDDD